MSPTPGAAGGAWFERLDEVRVGLATVGRLELLLQLHAATQREKERRSDRAFRWFEAALRVEEVMRARFHRRTCRIEWPVEVDVDAIAESDGLAIPGIEGMRNQVEAYAWTAACQLRAAAAPAMTRPLAALMESMSLREPGATPSFASLTIRSQHPGVRQTLRGPHETRLDPVFERCKSILERPRPGFTPSETDAAEYYWSLSAQESLASDLCALCAVEYDGLPLRFYCDMAMQGWDEARHAERYLEVGKELLLAARETTPEHPVVVGAARFLASGSGLPIALEGNMYEAIYNCDLVERLVLMQLDSEAPGIAPKRRLLRTEFFMVRPALQEALFFDLHDEMNHARIGATWLRHLLPDNVARRQAIEQTRLLRGFLLLTAVAHHNHRGVGAMADVVLSRK